MFTAQGQGSSRYQYRFWLFNGTNWSMVQDYPAGSSWMLPASAPAGNYVIAVDVRVSNSVDRDTVAYLYYQVTGSAPPPATGVTISPDQSSPHAAGTAVRLTAQGQGSTSYQYRFWLFDGTSWNLVQDYPIGSSWTLPASAPAGNYVIAVDVRTSNSVDRDAVSYLGYAVQ